MVVVVMVYAMLGAEVVKDRAQSILARVGGPARPGTEIRILEKNDRRELAETLQTCSAWQCGIAIFSHNGLEAARREDRIPNTFAQRNISDLAASSSAG